MPRPLEISVLNMKAKILASGLRDPIVVEGPYPNGVYVLVNGLTKLEAVKAIGLPNIPAEITEPTVPEQPETIPPVTEAPAPKAKAKAKRQPPRKDDDPRVARLRERQDQVLPLLKEGLPAKEIAERLGWSVSAIHSDRKALIESGKFIPVHENFRGNVASVGREHTTRVLDNSEMVLSGLASSLDGLRPEDLADISVNPQWEEAFKNAIRSMNRVRRLIR